MTTTVSEPVSSVLASSIPSAMPSQCNIELTITPPDDNMTGRFCSFNWPSIIPDVASSCCNDGAELQKAYNCTYFCERSDPHNGVRDWWDCLQRLEPGMKDLRGGIGCWYKNTEVTTVSGTSAPTGSTSGSDMASATSTGDAAQTSASGSGDADEDIEGDEEGAATIERLPLTPMGWFVSLLAIGAGFMA